MNSEVLSFGWFLRTWAFAGRPGRRRAGPALGGGGFFNRPQVHPHLELLPRERARLGLEQAGEGFALTKTSQVGLGANLS